MLGPGTWTPQGKTSFITLFPNVIPSSRAPIWLRALPSPRLLLQDPQAWGHPSSATSLPLLFLQVIFILQVYGPIQGSPFPRWYLLVTSSQWSLFWWPYLIRPTTCFLGGFFVVCFFLILESTEHPLTKAYFYLYTFIFLSSFTVSHLNFFPFSFSMTCSGPI